MPRKSAKMPMMPAKKKDMMMPDMMGAKKKPKKKGK